MLHPKAVIMMLPVSRVRRCIRRLLGDQRSLHSMNDTCTQEERHFCGYEARLQGWLQICKHAKYMITDPLRNSWGLLKLQHLGLGTSRAKQVSYHPSHWK